ncbi:MAG: hypothetical protein N3F67_00240 [Acidilobaceae archaeon]|nr:hypothetical protein [Acidilobaceae archaeon]
MVISVEISGALERRLRRLVELGVYPSAAEAVREAVRTLLERHDLREVALQTYVSKEASLHYVADIAGVGVEGMIEYMLSRGVLPALGALRSEDVAQLEGRVMVDPSALLVLYKSMLHRALAVSGLRALLPAQLAPLAQILEVKMARLGVPVRSSWEEIDVEPQEEGDELISPLERGIMERAREMGAILLSDDVRVRLRARRMGLRAYSSLSLIPTVMEKGERVEELGEIIMSVKAVPAAVPPELERGWLRSA